VNRWSATLLQMAFNAWHGHMLGQKQSRKSMSNFFKKMFGRTQNPVAIMQPLFAEWRKAAVMQRMASAAGKAKALVKSLTKETEELRAELAVKEREHRRLVDSYESLQASAPPPDHCPVSARSRSSPSTDSPAVGRPRSRIRFGTVSANHAPFWRRIPRGCIRSACLCRASSLRVTQTTRWLLRVCSQPGLLCRLHPVSLRRGRPAHGRPRLPA
jgi:hypothetical protein